MNTPVQRRELIDTIRQLPGWLETLVGSLTDDQLDTPYGDGKWTVRQVVHHLADSHINGYARMRLVLTEDMPTLITYQQELWAELPDARTLPIEPSMAILNGLHRRMAAMLDNASDDDWSRAADHPEDGTVTLDDLLAVYADHCERHLGHVRGLLDHEGWR